MLPRKLKKFLIQNNLLPQIPHSSYDAKTSNYTPLQDKLIDFRFERLFGNEKQKYKQFLNAYMRGNGVYAKLGSDWILLNIYNVKKATKPPKQALILPDNWYKVAKIIDNDFLFERPIGSVSDTINVKFDLQKTAHASERQSRTQGDFIQDADIKRAIQESIRVLAHNLIVDKIKINDYVCITNRSFKPNLNVVGSIKSVGGKLEFVIITIMKKDDFRPKSGTHWIKI